MAIERKKRLPDGSFGHIESVTGLPNVDPNLLVAFEAIAMQNEMLFEQKNQIEDLKLEVEALKGGAS